MKMMTDFATLVNKFLTEYLTSTRNVSINTILSYRDTMVLLIIFISENYEIRPEKLEIRQLSPEIIKKFLEWLEQNRKCSTSTRNQRLVAIHSFFRYVGSIQPECLFQTQQILSIPVKKTIQKVVKYLDTLQVKELLARPDTNTQKGRRDLALLCLMYDSGCRVQELADVKVRDVRITTPPQVTLIGKGQKTRTIPIMIETVEIIKNYINEHELSSQGMLDTPLFFNCKGTKLTRQGISYILQKYTNDIGLRNITPHILRHSKAMHLTEVDINPAYIRDFLGHTDLKVTQIYSKTSVEMKRKAFEKLNSKNPLIPKNNIKSKDWKGDKDLLEWLNSLGQ
jgi:integrase/recombinase XerD